MIEESQERSVCFASEKHKLINSICNKSAACKIKYSHRSDNNDILDNYQSSVKKIEKPSFEKPTHKITLTDGVDTISLIVYGALVTQLTGKMCYSFTSIFGIASKYLAQLQLKTTKFTTAIAIDDLKVDLKYDNLVDSYNLSMKGKIIAVDLETLDQELQCGICKVRIFFIQN